jgi:hypothetical protein
MKKYDTLIAALYQLAGQRLLCEEDLTPGQRNRLTELLLNALAEPRRYTPELIRTLTDLAMEV